MTKYKSKLLLIIIIFISLDCTDKKQKELESTDVETTKTSNKLLKPTATPPKDWVDKRVSNAQSRLSQTKEGQLLWKSIQAHGGLKRWYSNGALYFRFNYQPLKKQGPDTYQTVDTWSAKARHQLVSDSTIEYGWDGEKAWKYPYDANVKENPRFWALTPFYFVGVPFVIADEGITLKYKGVIEFENNKYYQVLVTFGDGLGDAPDDFYVLYIDVDTFRVGGLRYVVSYPGFYAKGEHGVEKHMTYYGKQIVDGIIFPQSIKTYKWDGNAPGEHTTNITISDMSFKPNTHLDYFTIPEGSRVMEGYKFNE